MWIGADRATAEACLREMPKTMTGKNPKFNLREKARSRDATGKTLQFQLGPKTTGLIDVVALRRQVRSSSGWRWP
jgi:hypothetical protein